MKKHFKNKKINCKMQKICLVMALLMLTALFSACRRDPILAYFADGTSAGSDNYTINVDFVDDTRYEDSYVDILLKSSIDDLKLKFKKEFDENLNMTIAKKEKWYSLTELIIASGSQEEYETIKEVVDLTLVMKSEQDAKLTLKAV